MYLWAYFNASMKNNFSIIYTLVIFSHCITFGNFNDPKNEYNFQIEFIDWVWRSMSPHKLHVMGPKLPSNKDYLERICDAAKNYILLDKNPEYYRLSVCLEPGRITYPDKVAQFEHLHILWCNTIPQVWLRTTESGELVIMIEYSVFVSDEKLSFDVKTIKSEPKPYTGRVLENEDNRLRVYFNSIEALHICWHAKKNIEFLRPILYGSDVGGEVFSFQYDDSSAEKRLALKCPSQPIMYVYFGDTEEDIRVVLVQENFRKRKRKITTPYHHIIPLNSAEDNKETLTTAMTPSTSIL